VGVLCLLLCELHAKGSGWPEADWVVEASHCLIGVVEWDV
jgi:hypothetical protein